MSESGSGAPEVAGAEAQSVGEMQLMQEHETQRWAGAGVGAEAWTGVGVGAEAWTGTETGAGAGEGRGLGRS